MNTRFTILALLSMLAFPGLCLASIGVIYQTTTPVEYADVFIGAANMDYDSGEELVYFRDSEDSHADQIVILDGETGMTDWVSPDWYLIFMPGYTIQEGIWTGTDYGLSEPFCDINADGIMELTFAIVDISPYEPYEIVVVGLVPTSAGDGIDTPAVGQLLEQNYPNPFNPATEIDYEVPTRGRVTIDIFDAGGRRVASLIDETLAAGSYTSSWNGRDDSGRPLASGTYFYQIQIGERRESRKALLVK